MRAYPADMRSRGPSTVLVLGVLAAACSSSTVTGAPAPSPQPSVSASPTPAARPTAAPRAVPAVVVDPLTGTSPRRRGPVVVVKVDDVPLARPYQRGLRQAAVVYQELVEGGATRLLAVLESDAAGTTEVGPVRSVRESDLELLRMYGRVAVGFSGGNAGVKATFAAAVRAGSVLDASYDSLPGAYRLAERRADARNFFTSAAALAAGRPGSGPRDIGLRFGRQPAGGVRTPVLHATYARQDTVDVRWNASTGTWVLSQGGTALPAAPRNVIVQVVRVTSSRYVDILGLGTPYTVSRGGGPAYVLRDGVRFPGRWVRSGYGATRFLDRAGHDLLLHAGPTWVFLLPSGGATSFG